MDNWLYYEVTWLDWKGIKIYLPRELEFGTFKVTFCKFFLFFHTWASRNLCLWQQFLLLLKFWKFCSIFGLMGNSFYRKTKDLIKIGKKHREWHTWQQNSIRWSDEFHFEVCVGNNRKRIIRQKQENLSFKLLK